LEQAVARVRGVRVATGYKTTTVDVGTASKMAAGVDPIAYPKVVDLHLKAGRLEQLGDNGVAVLDSLAASHHVTVGQTIPVRFAATGVRHLRVVAIFTQKVEAAPIVIGIRAFQANVASRLDTTINVATDPRIPTNAMRSALEAATSSYPTANVQTRWQY